MRYRVLQKIGQGGMAEVLEGVVVGSTGFERRVAIKRILPAFASEESFLRMFLDEARIASRLHHSGIVAVLDYGILEGRPFQVLELVEGEDLSALCRRGAEVGTPMPQSAALHVCAEIARALHYAHTAKDEQGYPLGVVHRDVSPTNILISFHGDVKLTDFGIALAHDRSERTEAGVTKGKRGYMAPEQLIGGAVDGRADVFSLGCVLHWILTGRSPLARPEQMERLLRDDELVLDPRLPADVAAIVKRATRSRAADRYRDAEALADALAEARARVTSTDGRADLVRWLRALQRAPEPDRAPQEEQESSLVDVELYLSTDPTGLRTYHTAAGPARRSRAPTAVARPPAVRRPPPSEPSASPRRWPVVPAALVLVAAAVGGGWWALGARSEGAGGGDSAPPDTGQPAAVAPTAPPPTTLVADVGPPPTTAVADVGPPPSHSPATRRDAGEANRGVAGQAAGRRTDGRGAAPRPSHVRSPDAGPPPSGVSPGGGYLFVGGEGSIDLEIYVDGTRLGRAPRRLQLAAGRHRIELRDGEGAVVAETEIPIGEQHTMRRPARWLLPSR